MSNIGYRVNQIINRPSKELIEGFKGMQSSSIGDCMNRMGALNEGIHQINRKNILGPAFTVKVPSGDNMFIFLAVDQAQEGDILIIDGEGCMERALVGELIAKFAQSKKLGGIIVNGCIRDYDVLENMEIPVFAKGCSPNGPFRNGPGELNTPISIGGKIINPGDIIVGDADGVVVIKPEDAELLQEETRQLEEKEAAILEKMAKGEGMDLEWLYQKLEKESCEIIKKHR